MLYFCISVPVPLHLQQFFLKVTSKYTKYEDQEQISPITCRYVSIHATHSLWGKTVQMLL